MSETLSLEQKTVQKYTKINPVTRQKKTLQELIVMFCRVFGRTCTVSAPAMFTAGSDEISHFRS